jgi:hypothetical protein
MNCRAEDCRIDRDAGQTLLGHPPLQLPALDHRTAEIVDPIALAEPRKLE